MRVQSFESPECERRWVEECQRKAAKAAVERDRYRSVQLGATPNLLLNKQEKRAGRKSKIPKSPVNEIIRNISTSRHFWSSYFLQHQVQSGMIRISTKRLTKVSSSPSSARTKLTNYRITRVGTHGNANERCSDRFVRSFETLLLVSRSSSCSGSQSGCEILKADDLAEWIFSVKVLGESLYEGGELFRTLAGHHTRRRCALIKWRKLDGRKVQRADSRLAFLHLLVCCFFELVMMLFLETFALVSLSTSLLSLD